MQTSPNKSYSLAVLDGLNMLLMNISAGVRPYLVVFLTTALHWSPVHIGYVMAISGIIGITVQAPAGALVDFTRNKRALIALAAFIVALCSLSTVLFPAFWLVIIAQSLASCADTVFVPGLIALSLGLVGQNALEERIGRNQTFIALGNGIVAILIAVLSHYYGVKWIYYLIAGLALCSIAVVFAIRKSDIDHEQAKGDTPSVSPKKEEKASSLFQATTVIFLLSIVLYNVANASLLPLLGQLMCKNSPQHACTFLSACMIVAQVVIVPLGIWIGKLAGHFSRRPLFLIAFAILPIRAFLYTLNHDPYYLLSLQVLDAICVTISGILSVMIAADIAKGSGKLNFMQGILSTAVGLGSALSNFASGYFVQYFGFNKSFLAFACLGGIAFLFFYFGMPETKESPQENPVLTT